MQLMQSLVWTCLDTRFLVPTGYGHMFNHRWVPACSSASCPSEDKSVGTGLGERWRRFIAISQIWRLNPWDKWEFCANRSPFASEFFTPLTGRRQLQFEHVRFHPKETRFSAGCLQHDGGFCSLKNRPSVLHWILSQTAVSHQFLGEDVTWGSHIFSNNILLLESWIPHHHRPKT